MKPPAAGLLTLALALAAFAAARAQPAPAGPAAWRGCCGLTPWPAAGPMPHKSRSSGVTYGGYAALVGGSATRHRLALATGVPAPYTTLHNPLPATPEVARRGAGVYEADCASCHGATGLGDGPAAGKLTPRPAELGWIDKLPENRQDSFLYWSIADGGARFSTAMPGFKGKLTDDQIWSVIGYIQARMPAAKAGR